MIGKIRMNLRKQILEKGQGYLSPTQKMYIMKTGKLTMSVFDRELIEELT